MDLTLNLIMMMPAAFKKRLLRGNDIHRDNRTMNPGMQIVLSILEQRGVTNNISSLEPKAIRDLYDKVAERLQKGPPRIKHQDHQIDVNNGSITVREYFPKQEAHNGQTLLYFHGGGFSIGSIRTHDTM